MKNVRIALAPLALVVMLTACGGSSTPAAGGGTQTANPGGSSIPTKPEHSPHSRPASTPTPVPAQQPVPAENNPPGDIPDNTQFVPYTSKAGGFTVTVPEGWSRKTSKDSVTFTDKLNTINVTWQAAAKAPTTKSANSTEVPQLKQTQLAFRLASVKTANLPAGNSVVIDYQANSQPNAVTGKQYRLDILRYELFNNGNEIAINLLSPVGADNVDPWNTVTQGFKWA
jgi:hypothetical protein